MFFGPSPSADLLRTNSESGTMQRSYHLTSAGLRRLVLALALAAPVAVAGSAWAQQAAAPPPAAAAPPPAAPGAAPAAPAAAGSMAPAPAGATDAEPKQLAHDMSV